ncbi:MAG: hypothetical protein ABSH56_11725 [Bryobacteraceae bacterium]|jgi:hypothetical protein
MDRLGDEDRVRQRIGKQFGIQLTKRELAVGGRSDGTERRHEFDGVSPDSQFVIEVKTNELKATPGKPKGRYESAIKQALMLDLYMLSRANAKEKLLVLTDRPLFDLCARDMDGLLTPDTQIVYCSAN